jgi:hypothetical protein
VIQMQSEKLRRFVILDIRNLQRYLDFDPPDDENSDRKGLGVNNWVLLEPVVFYHYKLDGARYRLVRKSLP